MKPAGCRPFNDNLRLARRARSLPHVSTHDVFETFHVIVVHVEFGFEPRSHRVSVAYVRAVLDPTGS